MVSSSAREAQAHPAYRRDKFFAERTGGEAPCSLCAPQLGLAGLLLLLSLACASASAPVTPAPRVSTGTPVADGIVQTTIEAATPTPPRTSKATSERTGEIQATVNDSKDTSDSVQRSGGTGDDQALTIPDKGELKYRCKNG